ncbi:hypothetical protein, partial [Sansalvadorimonas verongulae]|uniref:hypothetical protein n=1 Tax=Sansalvadorimonas verongulae TaxID=2172824 RepID=UPI0018AD2803
NSHLSELFLNFLNEAVETTKAREPESKGAHKEQEQDSNPVKALVDAANSFPDETIPDIATDPQIFSLSKSDAPETLLSPVPHTGLMNEIHLRLSGSKWWLKDSIHIGTGNDLHTYGDLFSDSGGELRVLRSRPPRPKRGEFRRLINQLQQVGHLYDFQTFKASLLEIGINYVDEETGQMRRWTTYRQNTLLRAELAKFSRNLFRLYRLLSMYLSIGLHVPEKCMHAISKNQAQQLLIEGRSITTRDVNLILEDLYPQLKSYLQAQAAEYGLPLTNHHHRLIYDALTRYLKQKGGLHSACQKTLKP